MDKALQQITDFVASVRPEEAPDKVKFPQLVTPALGAKPDSVFESAWATVDSANRTEVFAQLATE